MKRWLRRTLHQHGVKLPFTDVVCLEHVKSVAVAADGRTDVTIRRALFFLAPPLRGDLRDVVPLDGDADPGSVSVTSPDSMEVGRLRGTSGLQVYWVPKEPIVPYALYMHEYAWSSPGWYAEAAVYTELRCETRTGIMALEITTSGPIEAGIAFKRPRWRRMTTERSLVKHALTASESHLPATVREDGNRASWWVVRPQVGDRYVGVVFGENGVHQWQKRLEATSLAARMRRFFEPLIPV